MIEESNFVRRHWFHDLLSQPFYGRNAASIRQRILFLLIGNCVLLGFIYARSIQTEGVSFLSEVALIPVALAPVVIAGLGLTGIIYAGGIDLSISTIIVVAGTVFGILFHNQASPAVCFAGCFLTAVALSSFNGLLVRLLRISPIIVTLAGLQFYRGLALILADWSIPNFGGSLTVQADAYQTPAQQYAWQILAVTVVVSLIWEAYGKTHRKFLALGCSREACRIAGLHPDRITQTSYTVGGLFLGIAALLFVTNQQVIEPARMAQGFELKVIAAVVLGGTNIFGGEGSMLGTVLGALFLYLIEPAMIYAGVSEYYRTAIPGFMIVAVISIDCALHRRQKLLDELR